MTRAAGGEGGPAGGATRPRLDAELFRRGMYGSCERAAAAVLAGRVLVDGRPAVKPGQRVAPAARIEATAPDHPFVSRGGVKLAAALDRFVVSPAGWVCLDVGASTGGFTDCLLQRGARRVYTVDVGYGQLAWRLRQDPRVVVRERTNARRLTEAEVPEAVALAVIDVSFISLHKVLPAVGARVARDGSLVCLVKPQFEAGPEAVPAGGVVRDPEVHADVLAAFSAQAAALGWRIFGLMASPIRGADGNCEFLACLRRAEPPLPAAEWIAAALADAAALPARPVAAVPAEGRSPGDAQERRM